MRSRVNVNSPLILGAGLSLQSTLFFILSLSLCVAKLTSDGSGKARLSRDSLVVFSALVVAAIACIPGILVGNDEAYAYSFRLISCAIVTISVSILISKNNADFIYSFLLGLLASGIINAIIVIATSLVPSLYEIMMIREFSGFDKAIRPFRSPGLFRGYDTSGYYTVIAISVVPMLSGRYKVVQRFSVIILALMALAVVFSSRSSMFMMALVLCVSTIINWKSIGYTYKAAVLSAICLCLLVATTMAAAILGMSSPIGTDWVYNYMSIDIDSIYAVDGSDYAGHFDTSGIYFFPNRVDWLPDNFYIRSSLSVGVLAVVAMLVPIVAIHIASFFSHRGSLKYFSITFTLIYFSSNFKNNYLLFLPFYVITIVMFFTRFPLNSDKSHEN